MKFVVGGLVAGLVPLAFVLALIAIGASPSPASASPDQVCMTTGPVSGLDAAAAANARIVTAVAEKQSGPAGAVIAVMTADTESGLHVLGNTAVAGAGTSSQGLGSNMDSVGLFQQRASWGSVSQRLDPAQSTALFVGRLGGLSGWHLLQPWVAAQKIQVSAWDGHPRIQNLYSTDVGGNYKAHLALAQRVVASIDADGSKTSCGALTGGLPANAAPGSHGLPSEYVVPATATPAEAKVIRFAIAQLDKPYVFGAAGPNAFDCSGLVVAAWHTAGRQLPHLASAQARAGSATTAGALVPGDLVLVPGDDGTLAAPGHVGIFLGSGLVINAADERDGIRVQTYANFLTVGHGLSALRHIE